jgi:hypothetical protein
MNLTVYIDASLAHRVNAQAAVEKRSRNSLVRAALEAYVAPRAQAEWGDFFALLEGAPMPADFLCPEERTHVAPQRDPLEGVTP